MTREAANQSWQSRTRNCKMICSGKGAVGRGEGWIVGENSG